MNEDKKASLESRLPHACHYIDPVSGGISPPLQFSTTYARDAEYEYLSDYSYSRSGNPSWEVLEQVCAELDGGAEAKCFASGMAAVCAFFETVNSGEHVVAPRVMYHGSQDWLRRISEKRAIGLSFFDAGDIEKLREVVQPGKTSVVWIETPVNPTWDVIDIAAASEIAHGVGAWLAVDSTVPTPVLTQPIKHGADIVMHSATKYLNGHCDIVAGALVTAKEDELWARVCEVRTQAGAILGSFEAWLLQRGMRTLFLRVRKACESALAIAEHFDGHSSVEAVIYPGLTSHPGHKIARRQMDGGFGGMLSIQAKGGAEGALNVARRCKVFTRATSLGGVESLIEHRYSIEGERSPVPRDWLRLSIGIESVDDLIADLEQALE
jgi:cystathionine gamma-synthase